MSNIHAICPQCGSTKNFYFRSETWTYEINGNEVPIVVKVPYCRKCRVAAISNSLKNLIKKEINQKTKETDRENKQEIKRKQRNEEEFFYEKY